MNKSILLKGGEVVDVINLKRAKQDVLIEDGKISKVGGDLSGDRVIDCSGMLISPGLIDIHAHIREPGFEHKEDFNTGTRAAA